MSPASDPFAPASDPFEGLGPDSKPFSSSTPDQVVSRHLASLRKKADLTQTELAVLMGDRGFDWTKYTVQRPEAGKRKFTRE